MICDPKEPKNITIGDPTNSDYTIGIVDCNNVSSQKTIDSKVAIYQEEGTALNVKLCNNKDFEKTILCDKNTGNKVVVEYVYDTVLGSRVITYWNIITNSVYSGNPATDLITCSDIDVESDSIEGCGDGQSVIQWVLKKDGIPTGVVYYTNLAGTVIPTPLTFVIGKCPEIVAPPEVPNGITYIDDINVNNPQPVIVKSLTITKQSGGDIEISFDGGTTFPLIIKANGSRTWGNINQSGLDVSNMRFRQLVNGVYDLIWEI